MQNNTMTPLKFTPLYKTPLWGGEDIVRLKKASNYSTIGESWEISAVPGDETLVAEGQHQGQTLRQLIAQYGEQLVGKANFERYGKDFPLLIKFISASQPLSIQVHPDNEMAQRIEDKPYGKTEMWYVVDTHPKADLYLGFRQDLNADSYLAHLNDGTLLDTLNHVQTQPGDSFFIRAGQIHSIGAGNFIIEIQQASDLTYRVYDFDRTDDNGQTRELHTEKAVQALDFKAKADHRSDYTPAFNTPLLLERHPEFSTLLYHCNDTTRAQFAAIDSFVIFIAYEGGATLTDNEGNTLTLQAGESLFFPATTQWVDICPSNGSTFSFLQTHIEAV